MSRTLIIPDLHHRTHIADQIISTIDHDDIVFLGDYFDDFGDSPETSGKTALWLKDSLSKPNRTHLIGNHDLAYWSDSNSTLIFCSGFSAEKSKAINSVLTKADWKKMKLTHWVGDWLLSHAGWSKYWYDSLDLTTWTPAFKKVLESEIKKAFKMNKSGNLHWIFEVGLRRGGSYPAGGLVWCDISEFRPIPGIKQCFGHTPLRLPAWDSSQENLCLDTQSNDWYGLINNGQLTAHRLIRD